MTVDTRGSWHSTRLEIIIHVCFAFPVGGLELGAIEGRPDEVPDASLLRSVNQAFALDDFALGADARLPDFVGATYGQTSRSWRAAESLQLVRPNAPYAPSNTLDSDAGSRESALTTWAPCAAKAAATSTLTTGGRAVHSAYLSRRRWLGCE